MKHDDRIKLDVIVAKEFDQVMICHPNPDVVCLEGGCIHCVDSGTWWTIDALEHYATEKGIKHRYAFLFGRNHWWWNQRKKLGDAGETFFGVGEDADDADHS